MAFNSYITLPKVRKDGEPDPANPVTYYSMQQNTDYLAYQRFGATDELISIDYTRSVPR
jgi:hypothetical protein